MKTKRLFICAILGILVLAGSLSWAGDRVTHRQGKQLERIAHGVRSGEISDRELSRLNREQWRIQGAKKRARPDGRISPLERRRLQGLQRRASSFIYRAKHNRVPPHRFGPHHKPHYYRHWPGYHDYHVYGGFSGPCYFFGWSIGLR